MSTRPRWILPAAFVPLGGATAAAILVLIRIGVVSLRYDAAVTRVPSGVRE